MKDIKEKVARQESKIENLENNYLGLGNDLKGLIKEIHGLATAIAVSAEKNENSMKKLDSVDKKANDASKQSQLNDGRLNAIEPFFQSLQKATWKFALMYVAGTTGAGLVGAVIVSFNK